MSAGPRNERGGPREKAAPTLNELLGEHTTTAANGKAKVGQSIAEIVAAFAIPEMDIYRGAESPEPQGTVNLKELIGAIRNGDFRQQVERVRELVASGDTDAANAEKKKLMAVSISGCVSGKPPRRARAVAEGRFQHNGLIQIDIDGKDNKDLVLDVRAMLIEDPRIVAVFRSPSGTGIKGIARIDGAAHRPSFAAVEKFFADLGITIDKSCKDEVRLCFVSYDPDAYLDLTKTARFVPLPAEVPETPPAAPVRHAAAAPVLREGKHPEMTFAAVQAMLACIPPNPPYDEWLKIASAVWNTVGEIDGNALLREWSPEETPDEYALKFPQRLMKVRIGTLVMRAKEYGFDARTAAREIHQHDTWSGKLNIDSESATPHSPIITARIPAELVERYGYPCTMHKEDKKICSEVGRICEPFWAALFAHENTVIRDPDENWFFHYDPKSGLYSPQTEDAIRTQISDRLRVAAKEWTDSDKDFSGLEKFRTTAMLKSIVGHLRGIAEKRGAFANRPRAIHLANCMLEIGEDGEYVQQPFSPEYFSRNQSPISYDPQARCPRFINELIAPAVTQTDAVIIQKYAGQILLGRNPAQRFVILDGLAARGKSTLANILQDVAGRVNCAQLRTDLLAERFELNSYHGKTLLHGVDVRGDFLNAKGTNVLKALVGGDRLQGEAKGVNTRLDIQGDFNVVITSNTRLRVKLDGDVDAWRRRLLIVRYEAPPPKMKIRNFNELLVAEEGPGIINWCLEGLRMLLADLDETGDIKLDDSQIKRVDSLLSESDSLRHFLKHRICKHEGRDVTVEELNTAYVEHCNDRGWQPVPIAEVQRNLQDAMINLFATNRRNDIIRNGKSQKGFKHVYLMEEVDDEEIQ